MVQLLDLNRVMIVRAVGRMPGSTVRAGARCSGWSAVIGICQLQQSPAVGRCGNMAKRKDAMAKKDVNAETLTAEESSAAEATTKGDSIQKDTASKAASAEKPKNGGKVVADVKVAAAEDSKGAAKAADAVKGAAIKATAQVGARWGCPLVCVASRLEAEAARGIGTRSMHTAAMLPCAGHLAGGGGGSAPLVTNTEY